MGIKTYSVHVFVCTCDICGRVEQVRENYSTAYNAAQAVRSIGWSYGKDKSVKCDVCRQSERHDRHKNK